MDIKISDHYQNMGLSVNQLGENHAAVMFGKDLVGFANSDHQASQVCFTFRMGYIIGNAAAKMEALC